MRTADPFEDIISGIRRAKPNGQAQEQPDSPDLSTLILTPAQWGKRDLPPEDHLDTEDGQKWLDRYIDAIKPDIVFADNLMSLTVGSLKETDSWRVPRPTVH